MSEDSRHKRADSVFAIDREWIKRPEDVAQLAFFLATQPDTGPTAQSYSLMRRDM
jgi:3-oxoacyl-[acyl-carrier protein] reductase